MPTLLLHSVNFNDLFLSAVEWDSATQQEKARYVMAGAVPVGSYCMQSAGADVECEFCSLAITPSALMRTQIEKNMISINYDRIYFELVHHTDRTTAVYAKYSTILGSRLIAYIPTATVPFATVSYPTVVK